MSNSNSNSNSGWELVVKNNKNTRNKLKRLMTIPTTPPQAGSLSNDTFSTVTEENVENASKAQGNNIRKKLKARVNTILFHGTTTAEGLFTRVKNVDNATTNIFMNPQPVDKNTSKMASELLLQTIMMRVYYVIRYTLVPKNDEYPNQFYIAISNTISKKNIQNMTYDEWENLIKREYVTLGKIMTAEHHDHKNKALQQYVNQNNRFAWNKLKNKNNTWVKIMQDAKNAVHKIIQAKTFRQRR